MQVFSCYEGGTMIKFQEIMLKLYDILTCLLKHTSMHKDNKFSKNNHK